MPASITAKRARLAAAIDRELFTIIAAHAFDPRGTRLPSRFEGASADGSLACDRRGCI